MKININFLISTDEEYKVHLFIVCRSEPADIFFLVDKSSSLKNRGNFLKELEFIARIIDTIIVGVGPDDSRVGLISFSTEALLEFGMSEYTSNEAVKRAVLALNFTTGDTYTHKAFDIMIDQFERFQRTSSRVKKIGNLNLYTETS